MQSIPKWIIWTLLIISLVGFFDATYLTIEHYANAIPPCSIGSCETVLTSQYSTVAGIPVALFGAGYYLAAFLGTAIYIDSKKKIFFNLVRILVSIGFLATLGLVYLQLFVIHAICLYCMGSAASTTILFITTLFSYGKKNNDTSNEQPA